MAHFLISYDLHKQRTYQPVWDKLETWGAVRLLESLWVVTRSSNATQMRDALKSVMDSDDAVAVLELKPDSDWATVNTRATGVNWLKQSL